MTLIDTATELRARALRSAVGGVTLGNLHRAYAEERGGVPGASLDDLTIMLEMVTYHGGRIPTCPA